MATGIFRRPPPIKRPTRAIGTMTKVTAVAGVKKSFGTVIS